MPLVYVKKKKTDYDDLTNSGKSAKQTLGLQDEGFLESGRKTRKLK